MARIATPKDHDGYEYDFMETPHHRYICIICQLPSRDPYMTGNCCRGQILCKSCLDQTLPINPGNCPICRKEGFVSYPNWHLDREIKSLLVYCTNKEKGCEWHGELYDIDNHLESSDGCQFEEVKCTNECGKMMERWCVTNHIENDCPNRRSECQQCYITGEYQFIEGEHKKVCPKVLIPCPNKCDVEVVPRESLEAHMKSCPLEMTQCEYYDVGCKVMVIRKDQDKHEKEKMEEHLMFTKLELATTKAKLADALKRLINLEVLMYLITDKAIVIPTSSAAAIYSTVKWCDKLTVMAKLFKSGSQVCPVVIQIPDINKKEKNKHPNNDWYSDSFHTHDSGYKLCLHFEGNGHKEGKSSYISVWIHLIKGEYDHSLTWPFKGMLRIMLLNQISDNKHVSEVVVYNESTPDVNAGRVLESNVSGSGWGIQKFISNKDLHQATDTCCFLKDDCVFFQVDFYNTSV